MTKPSDLPDVSGGERVLYKSPFSEALFSLQNFSDCDAIKIDNYA